MKSNLIILFIATIIIHGQYDFEWTAEQWPTEIGYLHFDLNRDGFPELIKTTDNVTAIYDGTNDWELTWVETDENLHYYSLFDTYQTDYDPSLEALFVGTDTVAATTSMRMFDVDTQTLEWSKEPIDGWIYSISGGDLDNDGNLELVFCNFIWDASDSRYWSRIFVLDAETGDVEWSSDYFDGYIVGPSTGDADDDGTIEIFFNIQNSADEVYLLYCYSFSDGCFLGDVNGDGTLNVLDVLRAVNIALGATDPTEEEFCAADWNGDDTVNVLDILGIVNAILNGRTVQRIGTYEEEWNSYQWSNEIGYVDHDLDRDKAPELVKATNNITAIYDGTDNWAVSWVESDTSIANYYLYDVYEADPNPAKEVLFLGNDSFNSVIRMFDAETQSNLWEAEIFGLTYYIDSGDLDNDGNLELVYSHFSWSDEDTSYWSQVVVLDAASGNTEWESDWFFGYIQGPSVGDVDGDGLDEFIINIYDWKNDSYWIGCMSSDAIPTRNFTEIVPIGQNNLSNIDKKFPQISRRFDRMQKPNWMRKLIH